jgi:hypothetical protein
MFQIRYEEVVQLEAFKGHAQLRISSSWFSARIEAFKGHAQL